MTRWYGAAFATLYGLALSIAGLTIASGGRGVVVDGVSRTVDQTFLTKMGFGVWLMLTIAAVAIPLVVLLTASLAVRRVAVVLLACAVLATIASIGLVFLPWRRSGRRALAPDVERRTHSLTSASGPRFTACPV